MAERVKALADPELVRDCFALSYRILKKNQGVWRLLTETMFPGYLFVASDDIEAFEKTIKRSTAFARLLGAERRALSRCGPRRPRSCMISAGRATWWAFPAAR